MKWAHIDEAGTSARERCCIVAGIVSSPDGQWRQLNQYLNELRQEFAPHDSSIIFHAKDIWHGAKKFPRDRWPHDRRKELLHELAKMPNIFRLPVIGAAVDKDKTPWSAKDGKKPDEQAWCYALAFGMCVINFEGFMRELPDQREVGIVIAEDVPHMRRYAHFGYKRISEKTEWGGGVNAQYLPVNRVVEEPLFTGKQGSALLQISDTIAFLLGRFRNGHDDVEPFIRHFESQIYVLPHQRWQPL